MRVTEGYTGSGSAVVVDEAAYLVNIWSPTDTWTPQNPSWQVEEFELTG